MKTIYAKTLLLILLGSTCILGLNKRNTPVNGLLLENVEALAGGEDKPAEVDCKDLGCLACPHGGHRVAWIDIIPR